MLGLGPPRPDDNDNDNDSGSAGVIIIYTLCIVKCEGVSESGGGSGAVVMTCLWRSGGHEKARSVGEEQ